MTHHRDPKYLDRAPTLTRNQEGSDVWTFGRVVMETAALNAVAGRPTTVVTSGGGTPTGVLLLQRPG